jgi:hypothetical protein
MDKSKIDKLNPQEYTHLPHAEQHFEDHEQTDVAIRPLVWTLIAIAAVIILSAVGMWGLFEVLKSHSDNAPDNQRLSQIEDLGPRQSLEGYPPLQGILSRDGNPNSAAQDMDEMRADNTKKLAGQAPMRAGMRPGMPIDRAIDEALAKGIFKTAPRGAATQPAGEQNPQE